MQLNHKLEQLFNYKDCTFSLGRPWRLLKSLENFKRGIQKSYSQKKSHRDATDTAVQDGVSDGKALVRAAKEKLGSTQTAVQHQKLFNLLMCRLAVLS